MVFATAVALKVRFRYMWSASRVRYGGRVVFTSEKGGRVGYSYTILIKIDRENKEKEEKLYDLWERSFGF